MINNSEKSIVQDIPKSLDGNDEVISISNIKIKEEERYKENDGVTWQEDVGKDENNISVIKVYEKSDTTQPKENPVDQMNLKMEKDMVNENIELDFCDILVDDLAETIVNGQNYHQTQQNCKQSGKDDKDDVASNDYFMNNKETEKYPRSDLHMNVSENITDHDSHRAADQSHVDTRPVDQLNSELNVNIANNEEKQEEDALQKIGRYDMEHYVPALGQTFNSFQDVEHLFDMFAKANYFMVIIMRSQRPGGRVMQATFGCYRSGQYRPNRIVNGNKKTIKTNCPFQINTRYSERTLLYRITKLDLSHNHPLNFSDVMSHRIYKKTNRRRKNSGSAKSMDRKSYPNESKLYPTMKTGRTNAMYQDHPNVYNYMPSNDGTMKVSPRGYPEYNWEYMDMNNMAPVPGHMMMNMGQMYNMEDYNTFYKTSPHCRINDKIEYMDSYYQTSKNRGPNSNETNLQHINSRYQNDIYQTVPTSQTHGTSPQSRSAQSPIISHTHVMSVPQSRIPHPHGHNIAHSHPQGSNSQSPVNQSQSSYSNGYIGNDPNIMIYQQNQEIMTRMGSQDSLNSKYDVSFTQDYRTQNNMMGMDSKYDLYVGLSSTNNSKYYYNNGYPDNNLNLSSIMENLPKSNIKDN